MTIASRLFRHRRPRTTQAARRRHMRVTHARPIRPVQSDDPSAAAMSEGTVAGRSFTYANPISGTRRAPAPTASTTPRLAVVDALVTLYLGADAHRLPRGISQQRTVTPSPLRR